MELEMEICEWCGASTPKLDYERMKILCDNCHNKRIAKLQAIVEFDVSGLKNPSKEFVRAVKRKVQEN